MRRLCALLCAAALTLLGACGFSGGVLPTSPAGLPTLTATPLPAATPSATPEPVQLAVTADMGQEYIDAIVFYGDSNTNALRLQGILPSEQVWTPPSGTLTLNRWDIDGVLYPETQAQMSLAGVAALRRPEYIIVNVGANGVSFMDEEYFKSEYAQMLEALKAASPDSKIICSSLFPVAESYPYQGDINNDKLTQASRWIYEVAEAEGVRFIDSAAAVRDDGGALPESLHIGDGYHLNAEAHRMVLQYIRTHAWL